MLLIFILSGKIRSVLGVIILLLTICLFFTPWLNSLYLEKETSLCLHWFSSCILQILESRVIEKVIRSQNKGKCPRDVVNMHNCCRSRKFYNNFIFPLSGWCPSWKNQSSFLFAFYLNNLGRILITWKCILWSVQPWKSI